MQADYKIKIDKKIFKVEKAEDSTGFLLWQVTNLWQRQIKKALKEYGLTHSQFVLLASILWFSEQRERATQILLSTHAKIDPMTTSAILRTLEKRGLLKRQEDREDTRAKVVELAPRGLEMARLAVKIVVDFDGEFFMPLGKAQDFNKKLISLIDRAKRD